jgi:Resolvase, N terminal domain
MSRPAGVKSDRVESGKLMRALKKGDVVVVTRLDRLARSTLDLLSILQRVTEAGAKFRSLKDFWACTPTHARAPRGPAGDSNRCANTTLSENRCYITLPIWTRACTHDALGDHPWPS